MGSKKAHKPISLPEIIPVFPLPNVVLFPSTVLPLHIFEPRYRKMVATALETDRMIVMTLLMPGTESDYFGNPPMFPVGCAGQIVSSQKTSDGRYEILLTGLTRVRILEEIPGAEYRQARVQAIPEEREWLSSGESWPEILNLLTLFKKSGNIEIIASDLDLAEPAAREITLNTMALHLNVQAVTRQKLLELNDLAERARVIAEHLTRTASGVQLLEKFRSLSPDDPRMN